MEAATPLKISTASSLEGQVSVFSKTADSQASRRPEATSVTDGPLESLDLLPALALMSAVPQ